MNNKISSFLIALFCLTVITLPSCSNDKDDDIHESVMTYDKLPQPAKDFITDYFSYTIVSQIDLINDDGEILYEVNFADGCEVIFNTEGIWQQVDAPSGKTIPDGITPKPIMDYLNIYYSDYGVNEINKTGYGYKVELVTELDLMFSQDGQFLGVMD